MNSSCRTYERMNVASNSGASAPGNISRSTASAARTVSAGACGSMAPVRQARASRVGSGGSGAGVDVRHQRAERLEVRLQVLGLVHHEAEALLDGHRHLDEVQRVETERAVDPLGERGVE